MAQNARGTIVEVVVVDIIKAVDACRNTVDACRRWIGRWRRANAARELAVGVTDPVTFVVVAVVVVFVVLVEAVAETFF